jgi:signal transduction histidine kinase
MKIKIRFIALRLSTQFLIASFPVILLCTVLIGSWIGHKVRTGMARRIGSEAAIYVDGYIESRLEFAENGMELTPASARSMDSLLRTTKLGEKVAAIYLWGPAGKLIYSRNKSLEGRNFPIDKGLAAAYAGNVYAEIVSPNLSDLGIEKDLRQWKHLIDSYVPIRKMGTEQTLATAEFFLTTDQLDQEVRAAELESWAIVAGVIGLAYFLLYGIVRNGSDMIDSQRSDLRMQLDLVTSLNRQNEQLNERVRAAAAKVTELNENFLRRISADLHDGPAQDLSLALMKVQTLCHGCEACQSKQRLEEELHTPGAPSVRALLQTALSELREIAAGLQLPNLDPLSVNQIVLRSVGDYKVKVGVAVDVDVPAGEVAASLPVKITLYRILQESLSNGYRHADGKDQRVRVQYADEWVYVEVRDGGDGFDVDAVPDNGHLGLKGMRERVEVLGGSFKIDSTPGEGVTVLFGLPLAAQGEAHV